MSYQVTARKWRPQVFEDVVGQSHVTSTLKNAIATSRVAHAFIFSGQRGCGKTTTARILAKALNCLSPKGQNPDNECDICKEITEGRSLDVIEIDGASNRGVEEIRNLRESVRYTPTRGKNKIYIIDEVHMLTKEAFNALLKTLEEPPSHVVFIFATTEVHKVPPTILSRCQRFDFRRISIDEIVARLKHIAREEGVSIDEESLMVVAKKGDGSLRDAQSIFDQVRSFCGNTITAEATLKTLNVVDQEMFFKVTELIRARNHKGGIELVDEIIQSGHDLREFVGGLAEHFRNLLVVASTGSQQLVEASDHYRQRYLEESKKFSEPDLLRLIKLANELEQSIRWAPQPRYKLEAGLLQMIAMEGSVKLDELLSQIDELKKRLSGSTSLATSGLSSPAAASSTRTVSSSPGERRAPDEQSPSSLKVTGTVSAGPLRTAAATAVRREFLAERSPVRPFSPAPGSTVTSTLRSQTEGLAEVLPPRSPEIASVSVPSSLALKSISADEAYARWQEWVGEVRKAKISIGSILDESRILDVQNGAVRIGCPDEYHVSHLKRNKEFLAESFRKVTGYSVRLEPVITAEPPLGQSSRQQSSGNGSGVSQRAPANGANLNEHPVIQALKKELGAEAVE